jgi:pyruvate formate lyase activating enzyme
MRAKIIGISRHRIEIDGPGITTLVAINGCTQACKYCLNPHAIAPTYKCKSYTAEELYNILTVDNLNFCATGGGIYKAL